MCVCVRAAWKPPNFLIVDGSQCGLHRPGGIGAFLLLLVTYMYIYVGIVYTGDQDEVNFGTVFNCYPLVLSAESLYRSKSGVMLRGGGVGIVMAADRLLPEAS